MAQTRLQLAQFDILKVLANGAALMASEGTEYSTDHAGIVQVCVNHVFIQPTIGQKRVSYISISLSVNTAPYFYLFFCFQHIFGQYFQTCVIYNNKLLYVLVNTLHIYESFPRLL